MLVKTYPLSPSLVKGRGRKKRGGFAPSLKYLLSLSFEARRSTKTELNPFVWF